MLLFIMINIIYYVRVFLFLFKVSMKFSIEVNAKSNKLSLYNDINKAADFA